MRGRLPGRLLTIALAMLRSTARKPFDPTREYRRVLIAHHLLLGDTILLTPLLAKLRKRYPGAEIWMTVAPAFAPLYETGPYGVRVLPYDPRQVETLLAALEVAGFDLAIVPGDNRYAWLARALGARTIVALEGDGARWKDWQVDRHVPWPGSPATLADIFAGLVDGADAPPFSVEQWPCPSSDMALPPSPYCVFHVSARNPLRRWAAGNWRSVADDLRRKGFVIVWSAAPGEGALIDEIAPDASDRRFAGNLDLAGLRHLISGAHLLVTVETGVAHLSRITGTPSVVIYGQGTPILHGNESFWREASPMQPVFVPDVPCRDQSHLFGRGLTWVRRCDRGPQSCSRAVCMEAASPDDVCQAAKTMLQAERRKGIE